MTARLRFASVLPLMFLAAACADDDKDKAAAVNGTEGGTEAGSGTGGRPPREAGGSPEAGEPDLLFDGRTPDTVVRAKVAARVQVARDDLGIPHIYAKTMKDGAFAQGYLHAKDRFFQLDLFRHLVEGKLSEYFGPGLFDTDVRNRSNMMTTDGVPVFQAMADSIGGSERELLDAFAAGVNRYIADLKSGKEKIPAGYVNNLLAKFKVELVPEWTAADTLAIGRLQEQNLSDTTAQDIGRGKAKDALSPELYADLVRYAPPDPIAILPDFYTSPYYGKNGCTTVSMCTASAPAAAKPNAAAPSPAATKAALSKLYRGVDFDAAARGIRLADPFGMDRMPEGVEGSNNWVVAGKHTATGNAFVLNDPHLRFYNPSLFYYAQTDTRVYGSGEGLSSAIGISFPGIPGVLIGHNENVAWGATTVGWDVSDVYVETVNAEGTGTLFKGDYVPFKVVTVDILVNGDNGMETRQQAFEIVPHHGVVMPGSKANGKAMTRKWTGHAAKSGVGALVDRLTARNIDEFMESMSRFYAGAQNWNGADTDGNTGYMPGAVIPVRDGVPGTCDPSIPMDGTGPCEWTGTIPVNEMPRVKNRDNGWVVTANNDVTGTLSDNDPLNDPQYLHAGNADGFRARRITDRVEELVTRGDVTRDEMVALQADTYSYEAKRLMPFILAARDAEPALVNSLKLDDALARLEAWDFTNPSGVAAPYRTDGGPSAAEITTSIAAALFNTFRARFYAAAFGDERAEYTIGFPDTPAALYLLEHAAEAQSGATAFDDITTNGKVETANELILGSLGKAVDFLTEKLGADPQGWRWGELHQVEVQDLFGEFGISFRTLGPFPRGGANSTVDVAGTGGALDVFHYFAGPQMRFVAEVGKDGITARSSLPGGEVDDPESPHYQDLLPLWLRNETFPLYFKSEDVVAHTESLLVIEPE